MIRLARRSDVERIRAIEIAAGAAFREVGMPAIAEAEPMPAEQLAAYADAGRGWVAVDADDVPVGYVVVDLVDGCAHVEQISVAPDHQGGGVGRALLDEVGRWANEQGMSALTLTTFTDVPWNAPLYEHVGFRRLDEHELTPGLVEKRHEEAEMGLDPSIRVCMRKDLCHMQP